MVEVNRVVKDLKKRIEKSEADRLVQKIKKKKTLYEALRLKPSKKIRKAQFLKFLEDRWKMPEVPCSPPSKREKARKDNKIKIPADL